MDKFKSSIVYRFISNNVLYSSVLKWWWGGEPDEKNVVSGLTLRDVYNVQKSWDVIYSKALVNGFLIFQRLFEIDPETQKFFKFIAEASKDEMANSMVFKAHIVNIMSSLNNAVVNLPQPEIVVHLMEKIGDSHNARGIRRRHFWLFRDVLLNILQQDLKFNNDTLNSWALFIEFITKHMFTKIPI